MTKNNNLIYKLLLFTLIAAPFVLLAMVVLSPGILINDENNFTHNIPLLGQYGLSAKFLNSLFNQSPGPLYQLIYYPLELIGIKPIREFRIINLLFLYSIVYLLYRLIKLENIENALLRALLIFVIPVTWATGGLALTEIPTIFFAICSLLVLKISLSVAKHQLLLLSISALLLGISIIGRMQFLVIIPAALYLLIKSKDVPWKSIIIFLLLSSILPLCLFITWKGFVPPHVQSVQSGINLMYLLFSFGFTWFFILLIYPDWYKIPKLGFYLKILGILTLVLFLLNVLFFNIGFMPIKTLTRLFPISIQSYYEHYSSLLFPCIMLCLSLLHFIALSYHISNSRGNTWQVFLLIAATLLAMTALKSSAQFSSRYPYQAFPLLLLFCAKDIKVNFSLLIRVLIGIGIGAVSLLLFYRQ
jgi:hypothetical protein